MKPSLNLMHVASKLLALFKNSNGELTRDETVCGHKLYRRRFGAVWYLVCPCCGRARELSVESKSI